MGGAAHPGPARQSWSITVTLLLFPTGGPQNEQQPAEGNTLMNARTVFLLSCLAVILSLASSLPAADRQLATLRPTSRIIGTGRTDPSNEHHSALTARPEQPPGMVWI